MEKKLLHMAFNQEVPDFLPYLSKGEKIPEHLRSALADKSRSSVVGGGILRAIATFVLGEAEFFKASGGVMLRYRSAANGAERWLLTDGQGWYGRGGVQAPHLLLLAEALWLGQHPEIKERVAALWRALPPKRTTARLRAAQQSKDQWMALADSLYYHAKTALDTRDQYDKNPPPSAALQPLSVEAVLQGVARPRPRPTGFLELLRGLVDVGGTALLTGPTGTFKTETAKRAALEAGARLVVLKGMPGLEDRDFIGGVYPGANGPEWKDGPLTEAFRLAQQGRCVLLIDELMRFEPFQLAVLVGALDQVSAAELAAMGLPDYPEEEEAGQPARYHVLRLPTGEKVVAPAHRLTVLATTNVGDDYAQAGALDAALLSRFALQLEFAYPEEAVVLPLYEAECPELAAAALRLEAWTREHTAEREGILARGATPRQSLALLRLARRLMTGGMAAAEAFGRAAEVTVLPFCAPRTPSGALEEAALEALRDAVRQALA